MTFKFVFAYLVFERLAYRPVYMHTYISRFLSRQTISFLIKNMFYFSKATLAKVSSFDDVKTVVIDMRMNRR